MVGPGGPVNPTRFFVICANVIGGCMGTTGPASTNPADGRPYAVDFPVVTIRDMVRAQAALLDSLGIGSLFCVVGGSMGGMQVLQWAVSYPDRVFAALPIAAAARHSAQNIAFHEVGRQAVMADPDWRRGRYLDEGTRPSKGLAVARMGAHITYLSEMALHRKFGRNFQDRTARTRFCVISFTSDWLFPTADSRAIVHALNAAAASVGFVEVASDKGHDAFLLEEPEMFAAARGFIDGAAR